MYEMVSSCACSFPEESENRVIPTRRECTNSYNVVGLVVAGLLAVNVVAFDRVRVGLVRGAKLARGAVQRVTLQIGHVH